MIYTKIVKPSISPTQLQRSKKEIEIGVISICLVLMACLYSCCILAWIVSLDLSNSYLLA